MHRIIAVSCLGLAFHLTQSELSHAEDGYTHVQIADCHVHLLDFLQNGDFYTEGQFVRGGTANQALRPGQRILALIKMMDHAHVSEALVMGMPFVKEWSQSDAARGGYYLDSDSRVVFARETDFTIGRAVIDFKEMSPDSNDSARIHPFICGFNPTDLGSVDRITKTIKEFPGVFKGIGEVMSRHDDLTNLTNGERPTADHPALQRVYDFAGMHGMPVSIHHNIAPISPSGEYRSPLYLAEILQCFEDHPRTTFIWCHAGISRRISVQSLPAILDEVLTDHKDHVYIDLSWVVLQDYVLKDLPTWTALIEKYPNNFMVGSDIVGGLRNYVSTIRSYDKLFSAFNDEKVVEKLASANLTTLMPRDGVTLRQDYKYPEGRFVPRRLE
jgi:hypothetical protein